MPLTQLRTVHLPFQKIFFVTGLVLARRLRTSILIMGTDQVRFEMLRGLWRGCTK